MYLHDGPRRPTPVMMHGARVVLFWPLLKTRLSEVLCAIFDVRVGVKLKLASSSNGSYRKIKRHTPIAR